MPKTIVESWKLEEIAQAIEEKDINGKKLVVPKYQRGHRWTKKQESEFIETLYKHLPIGCLIFHKKTQNGQEIYSIIDGLQRATAINNFLKNPTKDFSIEKISENDDTFKEKLFKILYKEPIDQSIQKRIILVIEKYFKEEINKYSEFKITKFRKYISTQLNINLDSINIDSLAELFDPIVDQKKQAFEQLKSGIHVSVQIYDGPCSSLSDLFTAINTSGTKLSKYEIFAASWPQTPISITNKFVIENVCKKYEFFEQQDIKYDENVSSNIRETKMVNIFEYVFGLEKYLVNKYPILNFKSKCDPDEAHEIVFELLAAICCDLKSLPILYEKLPQPKDLTVFEENLYSCIEFVSNNLKQFTDFKLNCQTKQKSICGSKAQIISLIAWVYRKKYENGIEKKSWQKQKAFVSKQIKLYFLHDSLTKYWDSATTTKIDSTLSKDRYSTKIDIETILADFDSYWNYSNENKQFEKFSEPKLNDKLILSVIYCPSFSANEQLNSNKFDIEHLFPKAKMEQLLKKVASDPQNIPSLPETHIGNLCLLPDSINRSKQDKTIYESFKDQELKDIEAKYTFTTKSMLDWINDDFEKGQFGILSSKYLAFLNKRKDMLSKKFEKGLKELIK